MTNVLIIFWFFCALIIIMTSRAYRVLICFGVFSLVTSLIYFSLGAPDVAMSEAAISAFTTIFFIVCIEKYYSGLQIEYIKSKLKYIIMFCIAAGLCVLFIINMPVGVYTSYLRMNYLENFIQDVGGVNSVTAIYLGYRVYDTLFEALLLVTAVVAVSHLSWFGRYAVHDGYHSEIESSRMTKFTMRIICPIILLFGAYLILNGHISAGGGFVGGVAIASFFICRYLVLGIYDLPIEKIMKMEEIVFINITVLPILAIFTGAFYVIPYRFQIVQDIYLIIMSILIGIKVACGFFVLFYRYIAIERMEE